MTGHVNGTNGASSSLRTRSEATRLQLAASKRLAAVGVKARPKTPAYTIDTPNDPVNEMVLLGAMCADEAVRADLVQRFPATHFYAEEHRNVFTALVKLTAEGLAFDPATLMRLQPEITADLIERIMTARPDVPPNLAYHIDCLELDAVCAAATGGPLSDLIEAVQDPKRSGDTLKSLAARVSDAFAGATSIARDAPFAFVDATELAKPCTYHAPVLPHFAVRRGRVSVIHAYAGVGKTILAQELLLAVAAGLPTCWGSLDVTAKGPVLHVDYEMGVEDLKDRYQRIAHARKVKLASLAGQLRLASFPKLYLSSDAVEVEEALVRACTGVVLAVFDNLGAATPHAPRGANDASIRIYLDLLTRVSIRTNTTIIVFAHDGKSSRETAGRASLQRMRGSSAIADAAGSAMGVTCRDGVLTIEHTKHGNSPKGASVRVRLIDVGDEYLDPASKSMRKPGLAISNVAGPEPLADDGPSDSAVSKAKTMIIEAVRGASSPPGIREVLRLVKGCNRETKSQALAELRESGMLIHADGPRGSKLLRLSDAVSEPDDLDDVEGNQDDDHPY